MLGKDDDRFDSAYALGHREGFSAGYVVGFSNGLADVQRRRANTRLRRRLAAQGPVPVPLPQPADRAGNGASL
jgi:hypothetical protein